MKRKQHCIQKRLLSILLILVLIFESLVYIPDTVYAADSLPLIDLAGKRGTFNSYSGICENIYNIENTPSDGYEIYMSNSSLLVSYNIDTFISDIYKNHGMGYKIVFNVYNPTSSSNTFTLGTGCSFYNKATTSSITGFGGCIISTGVGFDVKKGTLGTRYLYSGKYGTTDVTRYYVGDANVRTKCYTEGLSGYKTTNNPGFAIAWDGTIMPGETKTYSYVIGNSNVKTGNPSITARAWDDIWYEGLNAYISGYCSLDHWGDYMYGINYYFDNGHEQSISVIGVPVGEGSYIMSYGVNIPVPNLTEGQHTLNIYAYDNCLGRSNICTIPFNYTPIYNIIYNANGGTGAPPAQTKIKNQDLTLSYTQPTRTGYTFKGWSTSSTAITATYQAGGTYIANANATLYAVWQRNNYELNCNSVLNGVQSNSGHSGFKFSVDITDPINSSNNTIYDQSNIEDYHSSLPYGVNYSITLNNVTGYSTAQNPITGTVGASNIEVTPTWTANTYTISYDLNDISANSNPSHGTNHPTTATYNSSFTVNNPTMTGYTFTGWTITSMDSVTHIYDTSTTTDTSINSTKATSFKNLRSTAGTVTFKANWTPNNYKLEIDPNGSMAKVGTKTSLYSPSEDTGTPLIFDTSNWSQIDVASRTGYDLTGYFDAITGGTKVYDNTGTCVTSAYWSSSKAYKNPSNLKVYAQWAPKTTIHYEVNHYLMNTDGTTFTFKEKSVYNNGTSDSTVTLSNYKKTYDHFSYTGGKGSTSATNTKPASFDTTTTILQNGTRVINLYYSRDKYKLTINPNGGSYNNTTANSEIDIYYGGTLTINNPTKTGATFLGWLITGSGSSIMDNNNGTSTITIGTESITLTAKWSLQPVFTSTDTGTFYEGQDVNYSDLMYLVTCADNDYSGSASNTVYTIKSLVYSDGTTQIPNTSFILDTSSQKIGQLTITYSALDRIPDTSNNSNTTPQYVEITYTKICSIAYNDLPQLDLQSFFYADKSDTRLSRGTIESLLVSFAKASDKQDSVDNIPWWSKGPSTSVRSGHNTNTLSTLQNNIKTTGISNIILNTAYLRENPTAQSDINQQIKTAEQLGNLYDTNKTLFDAIYSLEVTYDTKDQFGKYASGKIAPVASVKGVTNNLAVDKVQSASDRTITILFTDGSLDEQMESERYIETVYEGSLVKNSFWGNFEYGRNKLLEILGLRDNKDTQASTKYTEHSNNINITINDYDTLNK